MRNTLADATRDAKPPVPRDFRGFSGAVAELAKWQHVAEKRGHQTVEELVRELLDFVAKKYEDT